MRSLDGYNGPATKLMQDAWYGSTVESTMASLTAKPDDKQ